MPIPFIEEFADQLGILRPVLEHNIGVLPEVETHAPDVGRLLEPRDVWRRAGDTLHRRDQSAHSHLVAAREHLALYLHLESIRQAEAGTLAHDPAPWRDVGILSDGEPSGVRLRPDMTALLHATPEHLAMVHAQLTKPSSIRDVRDAGGRLVRRYLSAAEEADVRAAEADALEARPEGCTCDPLFFVNGDLVGHLTGCALRTEAGA